MAKHSRYQQKVIGNYYKNREAISLQRVQELITELYLARGKRRATYWNTIAGHLEKLGVKQSQIDHLVGQDNPELVANLVKKLLSQ